MAMVKGSEIQLIDPVETTGHENTPLAARVPERLQQPWGFIDTTKVNADHFIAELRRLAESKHGVDTFSFRKPAPGVGISDETATEIAEKCGVVVACFGD